MFRGRSSSGRAPPCQGGGSEFEPRRPLQKRGHNVSCDLFFGFQQEIKMLGRSEFALRQGFAAQNACTAQKRRFFGSSGQRGEQGASEARKRPSGALGARCACRGVITPRASLVARSKKEVTTYVVTPFLDSGRKLKCSGEVNSPSVRALLRKTLVRRKSADFLDSDRKLKCSGEVNSPSAKVLLRKTLVRHKSVVFCFSRPNRYGTSETGCPVFYKNVPCQ